MDENIYKIAIAAFLHDIGKFAERARGSKEKGDEFEAAFYSDEEFLDANASLYQPFYGGRYTHKHAVYTAAFIDHIEKLLPKKFNQGEWGLDDPFITLAAGHHKPETPLQWVIAMADRVSSGFERDEFEDYNRAIGFRDYKKTRLLTIFEGISTDGVCREENLESYDYRYPLLELSPHNIFPTGRAEEREIDRQEASEEYRKLFSEFVYALEKLQHKQNIPLWFEHFESLFAIYASHIPAATVGKVVPDVSLYDHSKVTAALASSIYLYHIHENSMVKEHICDYSDKKLLFVTGDFYGIQDFIFSEGGSTGSAAAKLLRGRSFTVSLMSELAADMLCREIGLTTVSIVLNAAGKFTIIAPNTKEAGSKIKTVEAEINDWLMRLFYGELAIGITSVAASYDDLVSKRFGGLLEAIAGVEERKKYNKIDLNRYGGVVKEYLDQFNNELESPLCPFCGRRPSDFDVENDTVLGDVKSACKICRDHIYIGTKLVRASSIAITTVDADLHGEKLREAMFGRYQLSMEVSGKLNDLAAKGDLVKYWDISIKGDETVAKEITAKFINGYVPKYREEDNYDDRLCAGKKSEETKLELIETLNVAKELPKTFLHIAKKSLNPTDNQDKYTGIEALGVLKADVDNLGRVFCCGLRRNSLSRLASLSRQINYFFSMYLPHVLSTRDEYRDIYTVFAGGDDLFLIGPWNRIIDFADFIKKAFARYVCDNGNITISMGISLNKPGTPISIVSESSEKALKCSKQEDSDKGKDSITLFGETVKWKVYAELGCIKEKIEEWLENSTINDGMLYRLTRFIHLATEEKAVLEAKDGVAMGDWECLKWRALLKYSIARNVGKGLKGAEKEAVFRDVGDRIAYWFNEYGGAMKIPIWQILYNKR